MKKLLVGVAVLCLLTPTLALVAGDLMTRGTVVSVDLKARSITFKWTSQGQPTKEKTATWNDKTKWWDGMQGYEKRKPMTADLAKSLKAGSLISLETVDDVFVEVTTVVPKPED